MNSYRASGLPLVPMLRVADIARRLALSEDHVRERIVTRADFPAPAFQMGRTRRWEVADVERWIFGRRGRTSASTRSRRR